MVPVVEAYLAQTQQLRTQQQQHQLEGIARLTVSPAAAPGDYLVSVTLEKASLPVVIRQLLEQTSVSYVFKNVTLRGRAMARFDNLPLLQALNTLLEPHGFHAATEDGLLVIGDSLDKPAEASAGTTASAASPGGQTSAESAEPLHMEIPLKHLDVESASSLLQSLYPVGGGNARLVESGKRTETNTLYLRGPKQEVERAAVHIRRADQEPSHVVIEAFVVEFDSRALELFGIDITNASFNRYSDITTAFGALANRSLVFTSTAGSFNVTAFTAAIDALIAQDKGRIVARPFVSTVSGKPAVIDITSNFYVLSQTSVGGATIVTPTAITSGVILNITPVVRDDELIEVTLSVEESSFIPPPARTSPRLLTRTTPSPPCRWPAARRL
jgi:type II secretory pathway component GspD/PulD (secretin)